MVYGIAVGNPRASDRLFGTKALAKADLLKGNYIRDDTAIQNNKDYLNQQHQQLARQSTPCRAQGISCKCQQVYKSLLKLLTQEMQISCFFGLKYHKTRLSTKKQGI